MSIGHNSVEGQKLESFLVRVERLNDEIKVLQGDRKEVFAEAVASGFDKKVMQRVIRERAMDRADLDEFDELVKVYWGALGRA